MNRLTLEIERLNLVLKTKLEDLESWKNKYYELLKEI